MTQLSKGAPEEAGMHPEQIALIRQRGAEWAQQDNTMALALLVARRGVICLHDAWGPRTSTPDALPAEPDSIFPYSSISKAITAAAIMMLVEQGLLGLTRPVQYYIPELQGEGAEGILVHQLLTHTSGYNDDEANARAAERMNQGLELPQCPSNQHEALHAQLHTYYSLAVSKSAGKEMSYASINYDLLGEIIRRVSGMSYTDFLAEHLFGPLGMTSCRVGFHPSIEENMVRDFETQYMPEMPVGDEMRALASIPGASGSVFGSISDCATFAQMLLSGGQYGNTQLLTRASVDLMTNNQIPGIGTDFIGWHDEASWGYGLDVYSHERWPWNDGSLPSNRTFMHGGLGGVGFWVDPAYELVYLYFSYCSDVDLESGIYRWDADLFQNMVTAATAD